MARTWVGLVFLAIVSHAASVGFAADADLRKVELLRQQRQFEAALNELDLLDAQPNLPAELKKVIPLQKATTLIDAARLQPDSELALVTLIKAQPLLEQFLKANPEHPQVAKASAELGFVLRTRGETSLRQMEIPANSGKRKELMTQAQDELSQAKGMFESAVELYFKQYQAFGPHIDRVQMSQKFQRVREVERQMLRARLDAGMTEFQIAQTYDKENPKFKETLRAAHAKFEDLHKSYRSTLAGLLARLYQGKCLQELGDREKALGIFAELLSLKAEAETLQYLRAQALAAKLNCLNAGSAMDYLAVDKIAADWIRENPTATNSALGISIRYEQARALEGLTKDATLNLTVSKRDEFRNAALAIAREIASHPGVYRHSAEAMISRLKPVE
jgi:tetratricopeptide (TPR) repeat protein